MFEKSLILRNAGLRYIIEKELTARNSSPFEMFLSLINQGRERLEFERTLRNRGTILVQFNFGLRNNAFEKDQIEFERTLRNRGLDEFMGQNVGQYYFDRGHGL